MSHAVSAPPADSLYEQDFLLWSREQARLLEEQRFGELDLENLIDEVRSLGNSDKREIRSRLEVLIAHLLKWRYQPGRRSPSWRSTIRGQRKKIGKILDDNPSLRRYPAAQMDDAYIGARLAAADETGIDFTLFPEQLPFTAAEVLDPNFLPGQPDADGQP